MGDLPEAPALLALARDVLVNDLLPLLPAERRLDARLVANCMVIAEREAAADLTADPIHGELAVLYSGDALAHPAPSHSLPRTRGREWEGGEAEQGNDGKDAPELTYRLARELRIGAFENSPEREARARAILWRLTIAGLRLANPRFLAANGFA
ncbi:MAG: hypothetical protein WB678_02920 [Stellaceae bacterium]